MLIYAVIAQDFGVTFYMPYSEYNDILRYYNLSDPLHAHECIKTHHKLTLF